MSNLPSNSLQEGEHNLQEMKTKSPAWSSKGYHMYAKVAKTVHENIWISIFLCLTPYKKVKANPRSLFEQSWSWMGSWTWLGWFLRVFVPTLGISGVPGATYQLSSSANWFLRIFWKYLTIFRHEGCACHVISTVWTNICSLSPRRLVEIW